MNTRSSGHIARGKHPRLRFYSAALLGCLALAGTPLVCGPRDAHAQPLSDLASLWREVTLYRDEWGVPHVYADSPRALGFGLGYAEAEDHAESIQFAYRMVRGRLAAVLGEGYAQSDAFALRMGHAALAAAAFTQADALTRELCEGFALGFNAWLADNAASVPAWYDGVRPEDPLALWHAFLTSFAPLDLPIPYRTPPAMETGNAWAVAPSRAAEQAAMLVLSPHQHYDGPFQWSEVHLVMGDMDVYGAALRGVPAVVMGITPFHGWALTPNFADTADAFDELAAAAREPARNPKQVGGNTAADQPDLRSLLTLEYMSRTVPYYVLTPQGMEERGVPSYIGVRGPVFDAQGTLVSWAIGGFSDFGGIRQLIEMARARNLDAFRGALAMAQLPCFHVLYADAAGTLFYLYNAKAGSRDFPPELLDGPAAAQTALPWNRVVPGFLADWGWRQLIPLEAMPAAVNPESGFLQICNTTPWSVTDRGAPKPGMLPPWFIQDRDSYRAARVAALLRDGVLAFPEVRAMLFDTYAAGAADLTRSLLAAADAQAQRVAGAHPDLAAALDMLKKWNHIASPYAPEMTFFHLWWSLFRNRARDMSLPEPQLRNALAAADPRIAEIALGAAEQAAQTLRNEYGRLDVPWGDVHVLTRGKREEPIGGALSGEPVMTFSDIHFASGKWQATYGMGLALAAKFGPRVEAVSLVPFGASDVPGSPHYDDQLNLLLEQRFKTVRLYPEDVLARAADAKGCRIALMPRGVNGLVIVEAPVPVAARLEVAPVADGLPPGMVAFTPAVRVVRRPEGIPFQAWLRMEVPAALCRDGDCSALRLYAQEADGPWMPLEQVTVDAPGVFTAVRDVPASRYAVLGPAESAAPARGTSQARPGSAPSGARGIDLLLPRSGPAGVMAASRRIFRLERLDQNQGPNPEPSPPASGAPDGKTGQAPPPRSGTFRFEVHGPAPGPSEERPVMPEVPGYRYGPGLSDPLAGPDQAGAESPRKTFRIERLDRPELPETLPPLGGPDGAGPDRSDKVISPAEPEAHPAPASASQPAGQSPVQSPTGDISENQSSQTSPQRPTEAEPGKKKIMRIVPESPPPPPKDKNSSRPSLPDIIPQDPHFVFTPGQSK